jgi:RNA polymerase sigma-70 factor (ECF subfamily)
MDRTNPMTAHAAAWPLDASVAREPIAFDVVFRQYAPYVGRTLRWLGVSAANVEDVCQEVFIVVHRRLPEVDSSGSLRAWVRQICVHAARNERRRVRRKPEHHEPPADIATPAAQHGSVELREMQARLLAMLEQLTEDQRTVFVLYEIEQLSMAEVASAAQCPLQTAYSRLHAARARIQALQEGMR